MGILDFVLRLGTALLMGAVVGLERQWRQRMAGPRWLRPEPRRLSCVPLWFRDTSRGEAQIVSYVASVLVFSGGSDLQRRRQRPGAEHGRNRCDLWIRLGRQEEALEQLVMTLSLESGVSSVSWASRAPVSILERHVVRASAGERAT
jgi:uncharacterized membrane protein YhiD involved in acid resistance